MSSFVPLSLGMTSTACDKSIRESPCQCQETCEKGLGELDLSSLRRDSFGDLRAVPLPVRRVLQWQSQSPVGEVLERQNEGVNTRKMQRDCKEKLFYSEQSSRPPRIPSP